VLGPVLGVGSATAVALMSRVLTTVGDLLGAALAAGSSHRPPAERHRKVTSHVNSVK
jgi:hypothetical protein